MIGDRIRIIVGLLSVVATLGAVASPCAPALATQTTRAASQIEERFVIEFRARPGYFAGHSYVMYGRIDEAGRLRDPQLAGLRPDDGAFGFVVGSLAAYASTLKPNEDDLEGPVSTLYRRYITRQDYETVVALVEQARANPQLWKLVGNNCNDFIASIAEAIGLQTPSTLLPPDGFVDLLRTYNEP